MSDQWSPLEGLSIVVHQSVTCSWPERNCPQFQHSLQPASSPSGLAVFSLELLGHPNPCSVLVIINCVTAISHYGLAIQGIYSPGSLRLHATHDTIWPSMRAMSNRQAAMPRAGRCNMSRLLKARRTLLERCHKKYIGHPPLNSSCRRTVEWRLAN